jgi:hypothetical protein
VAPGAQASPLDDESPPAPPSSLAAPQEHAPYSPFVPQVSVPETPPAQEHARDSPGTQEPELPELLLQPATTAETNRVTGRSEARMRAVMADAGTLQYACKAQM